MVMPEPDAAEAAGFFLVLSPLDSMSQETPRTVIATTDELGLARAFVKTIVDTSLPDSAAVQAKISTATGDSVGGSPVRFVVFFEKD